MRDFSGTGLLIMFWLVSVVHGQEACYRRFMGDKCDAFRDIDTESLKRDIKDLGHGYELVIGRERWDENTGKFLTDLSFNFTVVQNDVPPLRSTFCDTVNSRPDINDCLGMENKLGPGTIIKQETITLEGNCTRNEDEQQDAQSQKRTELQLADALRAYDRAIFYNNVMTQKNLPDNTRQTNITVDLPLLTTNADFAAKYANDSMTFLLHSSKIPTECVHNWDLKVTPPDNTVLGLWKVSFSFQVDEVCQGDQATAECQEGWQSPESGKEYVCEGSTCYQRAPCVPPTCAVNEFGQDCTTCADGKFSLKSGMKAKQLDKCIDRSNASTACNQIANLKLMPCSSEITPRMKRLLSLVLDVDCHDDGSLQLTWGEQISKILQDNTGVFYFIKNVFNVTEDEFTLRYVQRGVEEEEGPGRRRLLSQDTALDNSVTLITYTRTTGTAQSSSTSSSSSSDNGMIFAIILTVAGVLAICAVLVGCKTSGVGGSGTSAAGVQLFHVQEHVYEPLYVFPSPKP